MTEHHEPHDHASGAHDHASGAHDHASGAHDHPSSHLATNPSIPRVIEAEMVDHGCGLTPANEGWFVVNMADAAGWRNAAMGSGVVFESEHNAFGHFGVNVQVLEPGQPNCKYHNEAAQEDFLVLHGACTVVIEDEERTLRAGDFVHCPPFTRHVFVGAGNGPCAILMIGARLPTADDDAAAGDGGYPTSEVAAKYGASVAIATSDPGEAYADAPPFEEVRLDLSWVLGGA